MINIYRTIYAIVSSAKIFTRNLALNADTEVLEAGVLQQNDLGYPDNP